MVIVATMITQEPGGRRGRETGKARRGRREGGAGGGIREARGGDPGRRGREAGKARPGNRKAKPGRHGRAGSYGGWVAAMPVGPAAAPMAGPTPASASRFSIVVMAPCRSPAYRWTTSVSVRALRRQVRLTQ